MCGIVGYVGPAEAAPILLDGLRRLEYRGYDSAGLALGNNGSLEIRKAVGRIQNLAAVRLRPSRPRHPRHQPHPLGHPRRGDRRKCPPAHRPERTHVLVHNGVIENYQKFREELEREGHVFQSETDTEVLAHLIGKYAIQLGEPSADHLVEAVRMALAKFTGTYGIAVMHATCRTC